MTAPNFIKIDRSQPFNPEAFLGKGWSFWKGPIDGNGLEGDVEQDERSLAITELDLNKIKLVTIFSNLGRKITGEEYLKRLKADKTICLDAKIFQFFWENQHLIPGEWKRRIDNVVRYILFDGSLIRSPDGRCCTLYLYFGFYVWGEHHLWLANVRDITRLSAIYNTDSYVRRSSFR